jgi:phage recombination protein Bet
MNPQQQQASGRAQPAASTTVTRPAGGGAGGKSDFELLLEKKTIEFAPFGAPEKDTIKLNPKIIMDLVAVPTKKGAMCTERDAIRFMMMCKARRLNPFEGDAFLIGYDTQNGPQFSLITAHQAFLKRAEVHAEYDGMSSGIILLDDGNIIERESDFHLPNEEVVGGWATVFFKNRSHPTTRKIRMERFNNGFAQWAKDPAGMIVKCAEADALRSSFPTLVGGLYLDSEIAMDFGDVAKMNTSRPLFPDKTSATAAETKAKSKTKPDPKQPGPAESNPPRFESDEPPQTEPEPERAPNPAAASNPAAEVLARLRNHAKMVNIKEGALLDFWSATGATDGSASSLEEVALSSPELIQSAMDNWPEFSASVKAAALKEEGGA